MERASSAHIDEQYNTNKISMVHETVNHSNDATRSGIFTGSDEGDISPP